MAGRRPPDRSLRHEDLGPIRGTERQRGHDERRRVRRRVVVPAEERERVPPEGRDVRAFECRRSQRGHAQAGSFEHECIRVESEEIEHGTQPAAPDRERGVHPRVATRS